jgi:hypothetical protein
VHPYVLDQSKDREWCVIQAGEYGPYWWKQYDFASDPTPEKDEEP